MSERKSEAQALELVAFTRQGSTLTGDWPLSQMPRLRDSLKTPDESTAAQWKVHGSQLQVTGGEPEIWLHLQGRATVELQCQRCLQGVVEDVVVDRRFRFVRDEAVAARLDEESEDDVLVMPPRLDAMELLEDELILSLPIVPMHETCPQPLLHVEPPDDPDMAVPNPFAALAALRTRKPS